MGRVTAGKSAHDADGLGPAFLGLQLYLLLALIDVQGTEMLRAGGCRIPARLASSLMFLKRGGPLPITALGKSLGMSHQLVAHRLKALSALGLIVSRRDRADQRRTLIHLTPAGQAEARRLEAVSRNAALAFQALFAETGSDLFEAIVRARRALVRQPLAERLSSKAVRSP